MVFGFPARSSSKSPGRAPTSIHEFTAKALDGTDVSLSRYRGKPMLIENVASL